MYVSKNHINSGLLNAISTTAFASFITEKVTIMCFSKKKTCNFWGGWDIFFFSLWYDVCVKKSRKIRAFERCVNHNTILFQFKINDFFIFFWLVFFFSQVVDQLFFSLAYDVYLKKSAKFRALERYLNEHTTLFHIKINDIFITFLVLSSWQGRPSWFVRLLHSLSQKISKNQASPTQYQTQTYLVQVLR